MAEEKITYGTIKHAPEIAAALAEFLAAWSSVERLLAESLACLLGTSFETANTIFYSSVNNRARLNLLRNLSERDFPDQHGRDKYLRALNDVSNLSDVRNEYMHGFWAKSLDEPARVLLFNYNKAPDHQRRKRRVTKNEFQPHIDKAADIALRINEFIQANAERIE